MLVRDLLAGRDRVHRPAGDLGIGVERDQEIHVVGRELAEHEPLGLQVDAHR